ncbi:hypothetical protein Tco_0115238 [Tanacetum coccineum]
MRRRQQGREEREIRLRRGTDSTYSTMKGLVVVDEDNEPSGEKIEEDKVVEGERQRPTRKVPEQDETEEQKYDRTGQEEEENGGEKERKEKWEKERREGEKEGRGRDE